CQTWLPKCLPTLQILHRPSCFTSSCCGNEWVQSGVSHRCLSSNSHASDAAWSLYPRAVASLVLGWLFRTFTQDWEKANNSLKFATQEYSSLE
ncbi:mCG1040955, partial [Mus musculus]